MEEEKIDFMYRKQNIIIITITLIFTSILVIGYYFYPRSIKLKLVQTCDIVQVDHPLIILSEKKAFERFLKETLKTSDLSEIPIDLTKLDFNRNDYALTFNKSLLTLKHSPYLSIKNDLCSYLKERPVIPTYSRNIDNKLYIYKLKNKNKYRSICP